MVATYTKPTTIPRWADTGTRVEPASSKKDTGWTFQEAPPYGWENWLQGITGDWVKWLDERFDDGAGAVADTLDIMQPGTGLVALKLESLTHTHNATVTATPTTTDQHGVVGNGSGAGSGVRGLGGATGRGGFFYGGGGVGSIGIEVDGNGVLGAYISGGGSNGTGLEVYGKGTGHGIDTLGGLGGGSYALKATSQNEKPAGVFFGSSGGGTSFGVEAYGDDTLAGYFDGGSGGGIEGKSTGAGIGVRGQSSTGVGVYATTGGVAARGALHISIQSAMPTTPLDGDVWYSRNRLYTKVLGETTQVTPTWASIFIAAGGTPSILQGVNISSVALSTATTITVTPAVAFNSSLNYAVQVTNNYNTDQFYTANALGSTVTIQGWDLSTGGAVNFTDGNIRRFAITIEATTHS